MGDQVGSTVGCAGVDEAEGAAMGGPGSRSHGEADSTQPRERALWCIVSPQMLKPTLRSVTVTFLEVR